MKIKTDPHESVIEEDLSNAEELVVMHNLRDEAHFREFEKGYTAMGYTIVYIHHYTGDKSYTMGVNKEWSMKPNE